jgi:hypothetical protein
VKVAREQGVWIFNDKILADKVIADTDPAYWPRILDHAKLRKHAREIADALAADEGVRKEMSWGKDVEGATMKAQAFVDKLLTHGFEDPILSAVGGYKVDDAIKRADSILASGEAFTDDETKLAVVLARAFQHKNERKLKAETVRVLDKVYQADLQSVIDSYTQSLASRIAAHKAFGGWVSKDFKRFSDNPFANSNKMNKYAQTYREDHPEWSEARVVATAQERVAQDGGLYYSPVARAEWLVRKAYVETRDVNVKEWLQNTYFPSVFNTLGQDMDYRVRTAQDIAAMTIKLPMLLGATVSSFVEVGNLAVRLYDPGKGISMPAALNMAMKRVIGKMKTDFTNAKAMQGIEGTIGIVMDTAFRTAAAATDSDRVVNPMVRKISDKYFHMIGLNWWTNTISGAAFDASASAIDELVDDNSRAAAKELRELGVTRAQWAAYKADPLAPDATSSARTAHADAHQAAYYARITWVNGARLHPYAGTRTGWGNNPKYALLWMLNDFPFAFGAVTFDRIAKLAARNPTTIGKMMPYVMMGLMFTMLGMISMALKGNYKDDDDLWSAVGKSALGPGAFLGQYEKLLKIVQSMVMDYQGNPFLMNISPAFGTVLSTNQVGYPTTAINSTALFGKDLKKDMRQDVTDFLKPVDDTREGFKNWLTS